MSTYSAFKLLNFTKQSLIRFKLTYQCNNYAKKDTVSPGLMGGALKKKKVGKLGPVMEKKVLPVETDAERLVTYVCGSNIYKTGEDVKLKPDSEYPEWLWSIRTGPPLPLEELDPETKEYWKRVRKMGLRRNNTMQKLLKF